MGVLGALGVAIGAVGAHNLRPHLTDVSFNSFETGVRYLFFHTLLLAAIGLADNKLQLKYTFWLILSGILMFSFSIFMLSTKSIHGMEWVSFLGPITPIGGLLLMSGWLSLAFESKNLLKV